MSVHMLVKRLAILAMLMASMFAGATAVSAQSTPGASPEATSGETSFDSDLAGVTVETTGDYYTISDSGDVPEYDNGEGQFAVFDAEYSSYEAYFYKDDYTPQDNLDTFQQSIEDEDTISDVQVLDEGEDGDVAYRLLEVTFENDNVNIFLIRNITNYLEDIDLFEVFYAHPDSWQEELETAQDEITIDGKPVLDGVDYADFEDLIGAPAGGTPAATPQN